jgi:hypothetical protein
MTIRLTPNASDVPRYFTYGELIRHGHVPYRDYRVEYPPAATIVFGLPALVATSARGYRIAFEALMGFCGCGVLLASSDVLRRQRGRLVAPLAFMGAAMLGLGAISLGHFDLAPALFSSLAIAALLRERVVAAAVLLGVAVAAKIYAIVLLPIFLIRLWRGSRRATWLCLAGCAATVVAFFLPFVVLSPGGTLWSLRDQAGRPLEIESSASAALLTAHQLLSLPIGVTFSHASTNLGGRSGQAAADATTVAEILVLIVVWLLFAERKQSDKTFLRAVAASVVAFVVLGKVFSPQYLLWLIPLVPLTGGAIALFGSAALGSAIALTRAYFPRYWAGVIGLKALPTWLLVSRDAVLIVLLAVLVHRAASDRTAPSPFPTAAKKPTARSPTR